MQFRYLWSLLFAIAILLPLIGTACSERHYYRAYDPYRNDYHRWNNHEEVYYQQWVVQNHRNRIEFRSLPSDDQRRYWEWRHNHRHKH